MKSSVHVSNYCFEKQHESELNNFNQKGSNTSGVVDYGDHDYALKARKSTHFYKFNEVN